MLAARYDLPANDTAIVYTVYADHWAPRTTAVVYWRNNNRITTALKTRETRGGGGQ